MAQILSERVLNGPSCCCEYVPQLGLAFFGTYTHQGSNATNPRSAFSDPERSGEVVAYNVREKGNGSAEVVGSSGSGSMEESNNDHPSLAAKPCSSFLIPGGVYDIHHSDGTVYFIATNGCLYTVRFFSQIFDLISDGESLVVDLRDTQKEEFNITKHVETRFGRVATVLVEDIFLKHDRLGQSPVPVVTHLTTIQSAIQSQDKDDHSTCDCVAVVDQSGDCHLIGTDILGDRFHCSFPAHPKSEAWTCKSIASGALLATGGDDGYLKLWDVTALREKANENGLKHLSPLCVYKHDCGVTAIEEVNDYDRNSNGDSIMLLTGSYDERARLLKISMEDMAPSNFSGRAAFSIEEVWKTSRLGDGLYRFVPGISSGSRNGRRGSAWEYLCANMREGFRTITIPEDGGKPNIGEPIQPWVNCENDEDDPCLAYGIGIVNPLDDSNDIYFLASSFKKQVHLLRKTL